MVAIPSSITDIPLSLLSVTHFLKGFTNAFPSGTPGFFYATTSSCVCPQCVCYCGQTRVVHGFGSVYLLKVIPVVEHQVPGVHRSPAYVYVSPVFIYELKGLRNKLVYLSCYFLLGTRCTASERGVISWVGPYRRCINCIF